MFGVNRRMHMKSNNREDEPRRYRKARATSSIRAARKVIEDIFGYPKGAVQIVYPNGRQARSDSTVGNLRRRWAE